jgi:sRNA-binding carbon storage regulator CsrA
MLSLGRTEGQGVLFEIPPSTEWRTIDVTMSRDRMGRRKMLIDAPKDIAIVRKELLNQSGRPNNGEELD